MSINAKFDEQSAEVRESLRGILATVKGSFAGVKSGLEMKVGTISIDGQLNSIHDYAARVFAKMGSAALAKIDNEKVKLAVRTERLFEELSAALKEQEWFCVDKIAGISVHKENALAGLNYRLDYARNALSGQGSTVENIVSDLYGLHHR